MEKRDERELSHADLPELLTVDDLVGPLKLSKDAIYRAAREGRLPCIRLGRTIRFDAAKIRGLSS